MPALHPNALAWNCFVVSDIISDCIYYLYSTYAAWYMCRCIGYRWYSGYRLCIESESGKMVYTSYTSYMSYKDAKLLMVAIHGHSWPWHKDVYTRKYWTKPPVFRVGPCRCGQMRVHWCITVYTRLHGCTPMYMVSLHWQMSWRPMSNQCGTHWYHTGLHWLTSILSWNWVQCTSV